MLFNKQPQPDSLEVSVTLEATLDQGAELLGELLLVKEVVNTETRTRSLRRVSWSDTALGGADRLAAKLNLLETVDDLVEVEDEVGTVGNEETAIAVQAYGRARVSEMLAEGRRRRYRRERETEAYPS
jgi:hypothetical protein